MKAKVTGKIQLGARSFLIEVMTETNAETHKAMAFIDSYPKTGPKGETDLVAAYKITPEGYEYFSVVSRKAGQELMLGQSKQEPGKLFTKGWKPLYQAAPIPTPAAQAPNPESDSQDSEFEVPF